MVTDFDKAFLNKIRAAWPNTQYANTQIAYYMAYDTSDDPTKKLQFPLINIYRPSGYELLPNQTIAAKLRGVYLYNQHTQKMYYARFLMANLAYQLDFYAKTPEEIDSITGDIITMLSLSPTLTVTQTSNNKAVKYTETYDITYLKGPQDESDFAEGQRVYRYALAYEIKNARLVNFKEITELKEIQVILNTEKNIINFTDDTISGWQEVN